MDLHENRNHREGTEEAGGVMSTIYNVTVKGPNEPEFIAYSEKDLDDAVGHAEFLIASMPGAKVSIDRVDWDNEDR